MWLRRLKGLNQSVSAVALYCGVSQSPSFPGGSTLDFWFSDSDYSEIYRTMVETSPGEQNHLVMLQSPDENEKPTVLLLKFCNARQSADWRSEKNIQAEKMLATAEQLIPGFRDTVEVVEVGSPLTFECFTGNTGGALYGFENTREIYGEARLPNTTYLKNLFQTGHWCKPGGGVWNVMECGYTAAQVILRQVK
jgi:prolycopene isomerase